MADKFVDRDKIVPYSTLPVTLCSAFLLTKANVEREQSRVYSSKTVAS